MNLRFLSILLLSLLLLFKITQSGELSSEPLETGIGNWTSALTPIRQDLALKINQVLPQPQAGLLSGILLGERSSLPYDFGTALRKTSTIHIVVVSGQNLTLLIGFILGLATLLGRRKTILIAFLVIIFYSLLTGLQVPVLRAAIMVSLGLLAQLFGREGESFWILCLTGLLMLIYNPSWITSISFQLSFLATIGVVVVAPEIMKFKVTKATKETKETKVGKGTFLLKEDFSVSLAAQALTWPVIAINFHQFSLVAILVNSLILWVIPFVMISGIVVLFASLISLELAWVVGLVPSVLLTYFVDIVKFFNTLKSASIYVGPESGVVWVGYYILLLGGFLILRKHNLSLEDQK